VIWFVLTTGARWEGVPLELGCSGRTAHRRLRAWEEAGIIVKITYDLGLIPERRRPDQLTAQAPKAAYHFFEGTVEKQESQWPEMHKRTRQWMSFSQATQALADRPELLDALNRCTMHR